ncbi:MAG: hypothetical protein IPM29_11905 [Planctomycetes bacterium]|nr:hypothetical protein [Planctomycetota bacterium]
MSIRRRLATRPLPYEAALELALAETAAVLVWALDAGAEPSDETWLLYRAAEHRLEVGVPIAAGLQPPQGLLRHDVECEPVGEPHPPWLERLRERLERDPELGAGTVLVRADHDPDSGDVVRLALHRLVADAPAG